jgi:hypothetical protein
MQLDLGALWRHEMLRRVEEAQRVQAATVPSPPPASPGRLAVLWRRARERFRAQRCRARRGAEVPVVEIDLTDGGAPVPDALRSTTAAVPEPRGR